MSETAEFTRDGLTFDVTVSGPPDGEAVLLLHGFPQHRDSWDEVAPLLNAAGYRTLAVDQRGYSPRARPKGRWAYRGSQLVADAAAAIDQLAGGRAHVVGHDWGAAVAWSLAAAHPDKVATLTALSVPHPFAFVRAMATTRQGLSSWYMYFFQLPWLPERFLERRRAQEWLARTGQTPENLRRDVAAFESRDALTAALNWYRAMSFGDPRKTMAKVRVPTLFVWSDGDTAIERSSADLCAEYVTGPYRRETLAGVSHWIPDLAAGPAVELMLPHLASR